MNICNMYLWQLICYDVGMQYLTNINHVSVYDRSGCQTPLFRIYGLARGLDVITLGLL